MLNKGKKGRTVKQRLEDMSSLVDSGCIEWTGCKDKDGYGFIRVNGKNLKAHRESYSQHHGVTITKDEHVCHTCDNPPCINPDHLWLGDNSSNQIDSVRKGRNGSQKLSVDAVIDCRNKYFNGEYTQEQLCDIYKVSTGIMSQAINGKKWKHVNI